MEVRDGFLPALCIHSLREAPTTAVFGILAEGQKYFGYGLNERELTEGFWKLDPVPLSSMGQAFNGMEIRGYVRLKRTQSGWNLEFISSFEISI
jgi:hypothetical protein